MTEAQTLHIGGRTGAGQHDWVGPQHRPAIPTTQWQPIHVTTHAVLMTWLATLALGCNALSDPHAFFTV